MKKYIAFSIITIMVIVLLRVLFCNMQTTISTLIQ